MPTTRSLTVVQNSPQVEVELVKWRTRTATTPTTAGTTALALFACLCAPTRRRTYQHNSTLTNTHTHQYKHFSHYLSAHILIRMRVVCAQLAGQYNSFGRPWQFWTAVAALACSLFVCENNV